VAAAARPANSAVMVFTFSALIRNSSIGYFLPA
jgi:hypothetical protein